MIRDFVGLGARSVRVVQELRKEILDGVFTPGSKLPTEMELCRRFGITRPTVRRGIAKLVAEGLITVRNGAGMFVNPRENVVVSSSRTIAVMYPFDAASLSVVQSVLSDSGHLLCTYSQMDWYWDPARERAFLESVRRERLKGLVAFCSPKPPLNEDILAEISALGTRVVHIEPYATTMPLQNYVLPDYRRAGIMAVTEFLLAGCTDVRVIAMGGAPYQLLLEQGVAEALRDHANRDVTPEAVRLPVLIEPDPAGQKVVGQFLDTMKERTGFLCASSIGAGVLTQLARNRGIRVPDDIAIMATQHRPGTEAPVVDTLVFDRTPLVSEAVQWITQPGPPTLRRLMKPERVRLGTVQPAHRQERGIPQAMEGT